MWPVRTGTLQPAECRYRQIISPRKPAAQCFGGNVSADLLCSEALLRTGCDTYPCSSVQFHVKQHQQIINMKQIQTKRYKNKLLVMMFIFIQNSHLQWNTLPHTQLQLRYKLYQKYRKVQKRALSYCTNSYFCHLGDVLCYNATLMNWHISCHKIFASFQYLYYTVVITEKFCKIKDIQPA